MRPSTAGQSVRTGPELWSSVIMMIAVMNSALVFFCRPGLGPKTSSGSCPPADCASQWSVTGRTWMGHSLDPYM